MLERTKGLARAARTVARSWREAWRLCGEAADRLNAYEMEEQERREWEGDVLEALREKGYAVRTHLRDEPCASCTIATAVEQLAPRGLAEAVAAEVETERDLARKKLAAEGENAKNETIAAVTLLDGIMEHAQAGATGLGMGV